MNAELLRNMSIIADDENLLKRAAKYLRKLVAEKQADPTLMTYVSPHKAKGPGIAQYSALIGNQS